MDAVPTNRRRLRLDVYGLRLAVECDWPEVADALRDDFSWFVRDDGPASTTLRIERRTPDFEAIGPATASFVTPRNTVYRNGTASLVDYFGRAATLLDRGRTVVTVQGEDESLVHEAAYQFILSHAGEHLDGVGLTRLHALGVVGRGGAVALMLPSGGGKTRMALSALADEGVRLLSEDTPLLDRRGYLHPFPLRIGVNEGDAERLPAGRQRRVERMEFHPKVLLALDAIAHRIEPEPQPLVHLVVGRRSLGRDATLERVSRRVAVGPLLREAVVGVGVYQGMEFVLQRGPRDVLTKGGIAARRAAHCAAGLARANVWLLTLGRDPDRNWQALAPLLR
jgi:ketosteroid isomerase-like protein